MNIVKQLDEPYPGSVSAASKPPEIATECHFRYWSWGLLVFVTLWGAGYLWLAHDPIGLLQKNWIFIPVGFCGAVLGNISAVGGGIVFIPVIILLFHLPPVTALKIALASQSWGMTSGAIGWMQKRVVPFRALKLTIPGLLAGSSVGTLVVHPNALLVKLLFGPVSIMLGVLRGCPASHLCSTHFWHILSPFVVLGRPFSAQERLSLPRFRAAG